MKEESEKKPKDERERSTKATRGSQGTLETPKTMQKQLTVIKEGKQEEGDKYFIYISNSQELFEVSLENSVIKSEARVCEKVQVKVDPLLH